MSRKLATLKVLQGYAGKVFESAGPNRGPEIDHANEFAGVPLGSSYCVTVAKWARALTYRGDYPMLDLSTGAGFVAFCHKVRPFVSAQVGLLASCTSQMQWAMSKGLWHPRAELLTGKYTPVPGDNIIYQFKLDPDPGEDTQRHYGTIEAWHGSTFVTIEGNTSAEPADQSNDAKHGGVFRKHRHFNPTVMGVFKVPD